MSQGLRGPKSKSPGLGVMDPWDWGFRVPSPWSGVEGTHLWGQMHEQHSGHRALGLTVALFRPMQGVGLEYLQEPLLPAPGDPIRAGPPRSPPPPSGRLFPGYKAVAGVQADGPGGCGAGGPWVSLAAYP